MSVDIREVRTRQDLGTFIRLAYEIHKGHKGWVPPLYSEEWKFFRAETNRAFAYSKAILALAFENAAPVGRIMGLINSRYNEAKGERQARFACLECRPEASDVAHALLAFVEDWAKRLGMSRLVGPMGFTDEDPQGFLLEGYEHEPSVGTYYNFDVFPSLMESEGYEKEMDYAVYRVDLPAEVPGFYRKIAERAARKNVCRVLDINRRRQLKPYIKPVLRLMNHCFQELYGYSALDEGEMSDLAKRFLPVLDPRFVKIALSGDEVVGFNIAMPNLAEGFRRARGHLFPFGLFHILRAQRRTRQLDSLVGGIRSDFRGKGVDALIGSATMAAAIKAGFEFVDTHHELEYNRKVRGEMEKLGGQVYKRFRIYRKFLRDPAVGRAAEHEPPGQDRELRRPERSA